MTFARVAALLTVIGLGVAAGAAPASAVPDVSGVHDSTAFQWVGAGDGTSWGDPSNWAPAGVPGSGDRATIDSAFATCSIDVTNVPDGTSVADLSLSANSGCPLEISGGALTVTQSLDWGAGVVDLPLTLPASASALLVGDGAVARELDGSMVVSGSLTLHAATITGDAGQITVTAGGSLIGGTVDGTVQNIAGTVSDDEGHLAPSLTIGHYTQGPAGTLEVIVTASSFYDIGFGTATVHGTIQFDNRIKDAPLHDLIGAIGSPSTMTWEPTCRITIGRESRADHWKPTEGTDGTESFVKIHLVAGAQRHC